MSRLFVDANILMEIMMSRSKTEQISTIFHNSEYEFFISTLTVHIMYYFAEVESIERSFVRKLVDLAQHLPVNEKMIALAQQRYSGKDFEDCVQAACAELTGCNEILSLDKKFHQNSGTKLKVILID
jgi:predicted nucleic-acid-binding protein